MDNVSKKQAREQLDAHAAKVNSDDLERILKKKRRDNKKVLWQWIAR